ncbi:hypothetical protein [Janthinobacterium sp. SUN137]|uniref:hypothetical protein n=1 Tax=Janthinobacterium sp. SUN137 TaxID=3014789 RepID=UPI002714088B|nr:hypothetical protein [Janthinobacterium sp. SUN137]MDO8039899.1 hypothetical protein [Janthinobacterium sp. SUN137]
MTVRKDQIDRLLEHPSESLNVEVKTWIDPRAPEGIAKIVKGVFAIRNRNGGFLVIGLDNDTLRPDNYPYEVPAAQLFHLDKIQELVSRYANEPFEILVELRAFFNQIHPIIVIPEGVKVPSSVKSDLKGGEGKYLLAVGDIYFRTLNANGVPSSAKMSPRDLSSILDICFDNREADIGRFFRRQLASADASNLANFLMGRNFNEDNLKNRALSVIRKGDESFEKVLSKAPLSEEDSIALTFLTMSVGLVLHPKKADSLPTQEFMNTVASANPQYTGWPVWMDTRGFQRTSDRPMVVDGAWQTFINDINDWSANFEFMRIDPVGELFLRRVMQDDLMPSRITPGTALDVLLMVYRVAEVLAVGISIARATGWDQSEKAGFAFKWSGLEGRSLHAWANPNQFFFGASGVSNTLHANSFVEIPLDTPHSALAPHVAAAVAPLFASFNGFQVGLEAVEDCVRRMVERRIS